MLGLFKHNNWKLTMKIKNSIDVWETFEDTLNAKENSWMGSRLHYPLNKIFEFEDSDFITAIEICKEFKKYNLKQEVEADYRYWKSGMEFEFSENPSSWISKFRNDITRTRKYTSTAKKIDTTVESRFQNEFNLIRQFSKLADLFYNYNDYKRAYENSKKQYEEANSHMKNFMELKKSGLSPEEFWWILIEPKVEEQD